MIEEPVYHRCPMCGYGEAAGENFLCAPCRSAARDREARDLDQLGPGRDQR